MKQERQKQSQKPQRLLDNSRFYILSFSVLLSIIVVCGARLAIPSDSLFMIRTQQIFGLLAVALLYVATILTPLSKLVRHRAYIPQLLFARRAIGVAAAYYACLHVVIALVDQVGGWSGIWLLPDRFKFSFVLGALALLILALMAVTSFDKAIAFMTFRRWKMLHRFVYAAGVLTIVHIWLVGTHADYMSVRIIASVALAILFGLEAVRIAVTAASKYQLQSMLRLIVGLVAFGLMAGSVALLPLVAENYHSDRHIPGAPAHRAGHVPAGSELK